MAKNCPRRGEQLYFCRKNGQDPRVHFWFRFEAIFGYGRGPILVKSSWPFSVPRNIMNKARPGKMLASLCLFWLLHRCEIRLRPMPWFRTRFKTKNIIFLKKLRVCGGGWPCVWQALAGAGWEWLALPGSG